MSGCVVEVINGDEMTLLGMYPSVDAAQADIISKTEAVIQWTTLDEGNRVVLNAWSADEDHTKSFADLRFVLTITPAEA